MNKNFWSVNNMARMAMVATLYVVLTLSFAPISYAGFQFRVSEILVLLCFYDPKYCVSLILGCFISNLFAPGVVIFDLIFGTLHTAISVFCISKCKKNLALASLFPTIFGFVVGIGISLSYSLPYFLSTAQVMLGEIVVILGLGYPLFKALEKNKAFMKACDFKKTSNDSFVSSLGYVSILLMVVTIVLSFTLPLKDGVILFEVALENPYLFVLLGLELLSIILTLFAKQKVGKLAKLLVDILCILTFVIMNIVLPIFSLNSFIYLVVLVMISLTSLLNLNN
jgi:uncharacterized membrane protein